MEFLVRRRQSGTRLSVIKNWQVCPSNHRHRTSRSAARGPIAAGWRELYIIPLYLARSILPHVSRDRLGLDFVTNNHAWDISMQTASVYDSQARAGDLDLVHRYRRANN